MRLLRDTSIEKYEDIFVKREDLCFTRVNGLELPPLAKLRGAEFLLRRLKKEGYKTIGVFDTRVSKAGWGIAGICSYLGLRCRSYFPLLKNQKRFKDQQYMASLFGAKLVAIPAGRTAILYSIAKKDLARIKDSYMLPLGLVCIETVQEVAKIAGKIPKYGTIVICTGTGTITAGLLAGLTKENLPEKVIGVSCGMALKKQDQRITALLKETGKLKSKEILELVLVEKDYYSPENIIVPFPCHPYYDKKAWRWLMENKHKLKKPILFWNIGA